MLSAGDYPDQKSLAEAMGIDSSTLSNLLRLLKLPEAWRRRIISREMSERHARALLPFIKYPTILAAFDEFFVQNLDLAENRRELPTAAEWEEETVPRIVKDATRTMDGLHGDRMYFHPRWGRVSIFEPTVDQEKALKIIKLGDEELATNVELWEDLQKAHLEREKGRGQRSEVRDQEDDQAEDQADSPPEAVSADDAEEVEDAQIAEDGDEVPEDLHDAYSDPRRLDRPTAPKQGKEKGEKENATQPSDFYRWKLAWMRKLVAEAIDRCEFQQLVKLLCLGLGVWKIPADAVNQVFDEALRANIDYSRRKSVTVNLLAANDIQLEQVISEVVASWFWSEKEGPLADVPAEDCEEVAAFLEVDLDGEWQRGNILAPGPCSTYTTMRACVGLRRTGRSPSATIGTARASSASWSRSSATKTQTRSI